MATATFKLNKYTDTAGDGVPLDKNDSLYNPCFLNEDSNSTAVGSKPVGVPTTGTHYSFEVMLTLECTQAPNNQCNNFKFWGSSSIPATGILIYVAVATSESVPTNNLSTIATTRQDTNYVGSGTGDYLELTVQPGDSIIDAVGEETNLLVMQMWVNATASRGNVPTMIDYIEYDES